MKILDATCGARRMWYQKNHPFVTFMDKRKGDFGFISKKNGKGIKRETIKVNPDIQADWTKELSFEDEYFDMVVFDPPHIVRKKENNESFMQHQYGVFKAESYKQDLLKGFSELFRVLKDEGILILKWCDLDRSVEEILKLSPYPPLFGSRTGQRNNVHWIVFIKFQQNRYLLGFSPEKDKEVRS